MPSNKDLKRKVRRRMEQTGEPYAVARAIVDAPDVIHPSGVINQRVVNKVVARRGYLHAYETIEPRRTALVVIDLAEGSCRRDENCRTMVPNVNRLADALRQGGGVVAWVLSRLSSAETMARMVGTRAAAMYYEESQPGGPGTKFCQNLKVEDEDVLAVKTGASAFFPGRCGLHEELRERGVDTLLIAGTVTNICCESSARDACELGYKVTMVSDANAGHAFGLHEASLTTFYRIFGDVRPTADVISMIESSKDAVPDLD